ncbi:hypothetical protein EV182_002678 [Spiromyces aspiralis]|uniref:Uncharacterized protein n=1 Tax=Spiromyces aspiralis TaxID=68401 RepID=A0ACC1HTY9_9FUNG|nr:hypothetical protein EV182_002678 [Spiromyces aspiralis]
MAFDVALYFARRANSGADAAAQILFGILFGLSFTFNLAAVGTYILLRWRYPRKVDRISIRQLVAVCFVCGLLSFLSFAGYRSWIRGFFCRFYLWFEQSCLMLIFWLDFTLVLNFQLVIVHGVRNTKRIEPLYYIVAIVFAAIPMVVSLSVTSIPDFATVSCYPRSKAASRYKYAYIWLQLETWAMLGVCLTVISFITVLVVIHIRHSRSMLMVRQIAEATVETRLQPSCLATDAAPSAADPASRSSSGTLEWYSHRYLGQSATPRQPEPWESLSISGTLSRSQHQHQALKRMIKRLVWVPLLPLVSRSITTTCITLFYKHQDASSLIFLSAFAYFIQVAFMPIAFFTDVWVIKALKEARVELIERWYLAPLARARTHAPSPRPRRFLRRTPHRRASPVDEYAVRRSSSVYQPALDACSKWEPQLLDAGVPWHSAPPPPTAGATGRGGSPVVSPRSWPSPPGPVGAHRPATLSVSFHGLGKEHSIMGRPLLTAICAPYPAAKSASRSASLATARTIRNAIQAWPPGGARAVEVAAEKAPLKDRLLFWFCKRVLLADRYTRNSNG